MILFLNISSLFLSNNSRVVPCNFTDHDYKSRRKYFHKKQVTFRLMTVNVREGQHCLNSKNRHAWRWC